MTTEKPRQRRKKLFLHIGAPKTGSSVIQSFLARNQAALAARGLHYPELDEPLFPAGQGQITSGNGAGLARALLGPRHPAVLTGDARERAFAAFERVMAETPGDLLLSSEWFYVIQHRARMQLRRQIRDAGYQPWLIVYLRRQDEMVQSVYAQEVRRGGLSATAREFLDKTTERGRRLNYLSLLEDFAKAFPSARIRVRVYEPGQWVGGSLTSDFLDACGLSGTDGLDMEAERVNESLGRISLEWIRIGNSLPRGTEICRRMLRRLSVLDTREPIGRAVLPAEVRQQLIDQYAESNAELARQYLGREDGVLFRAPPPDPEAPWTDLSEDQLPPRARAAICGIRALDRVLGAFKPRG